MAEQTQTQTKAMTLQEKQNLALKNTVIGVQKSIDVYVQNGQLDFPQNYSVGNALKQAQLMIQDVDKLMQCTQASIGKALLDLVVLGLNVAKQQAYIIPYGNIAQLQISYQGKQLLAKRIDPTIEEIYAMPLKENEDFVFEDLFGGYSTVIKHQRNLITMREQSKRLLKAIEGDDVVKLNETIEDIYIGAYATIVYNDGKPPKSLIMMYDRIKQSWKQSSTKPIDENGNVALKATHAKFIDDMMCKTVITAICKPIINSSDDAHLYNRIAKSCEIQEVANEVQEEKETFANKGPIVDVEFEDSLTEEVAPTDTAIKHNVASADAELNVDIIE